MIFVLTWGWGWIVWSDMYWLGINNEDRDNEKAIRILKESLEVGGIEDKKVVQERLKSLYNEKQLLLMSDGLK